MLDFGRWAAASWEETGRVWLCYQIVRNVNNSLPTNSSTFILITPQASDLGPYHDPSVRPSFKSRLCNMSSRSWLLARDPPLFYPTLNYPMASTHTNNASAGRKSATRKSSAASDTSSAIPTVAGSVYEYSRIIDGVRNDFIVSNFFTTFIGGFETKKIVIGTRPAFPDEDGTSTFPCHLTCSLTGNSVSISMRPPAAQHDHLYRANHHRRRD